MTISKSLKLTAVSLGLASIAITGCKKNDKNTSGTGGVTDPTKVIEKEQKANKVNSIVISANSIPLGGCADYSVSFSNLEGNKASSNAISVSLSKDSLQSFYLDDKLSRICAYNRDNEEIKGENGSYIHSLIPGAETKATLVASYENAFATKEVVVSKKERAITDIEIVNKYDSIKKTYIRNANSKFSNPVKVGKVDSYEIAIAAGDESEEFLIQYTPFAKELNVDEETAKFYIYSEAKNVTLNSVPSNHKVTLKSEVKDNKLYFKIAVPKDYPVSKDIKLSLQVKGSQKAITLNLEVIKGIPKKVELLNDQSGLKTVPNVLQVGQQFDADLSVIYSNNESPINITQDPTERNFEVSSKDRNKITIETLSAVKKATNNRISLKAIANTDFNPVTLEFKVEDTVVEKIYYVGPKPILTKAIFTKNDQTQSASEIPVGGGSVNEKLHCTEITGVKYNNEQDAAEKSITNLNKFIVTVTNNDKFTIVDSKYVCAKANAVHGTNASTTDVIVSLKKDPTQNVKFTVKAIAPVDAGSFLATNVGGVVKPVDVIHLNVAKTESDPIYMFKKLSDNSVKSGGHIADIKSHLTFAISHAFKKYFKLDKTTNVDYITVKLDSSKPALTEHENYVTGTVTVKPDTAGGKANTHGFADESLLKVTYTK